MIARNAQSLTLGLGVQNALLTRAHTGTLQVPSLLQDLCIISRTVAGAPQPLTMIAAIRVAGQRIDVSNQNMDAGAFLANPSALTEHMRSIGVPLKGQQVVGVDLVCANATDQTGVSINTDSIDPDQVVPVNELGPTALTFCAGLGQSAAVAAGATGQLQAVVQRRCWLGRIGLTVTGALGNLGLCEIRGILINNLEMLAGANAPGVPTDAVPALNFGWSINDSDGLVLGVEVEANTTITINFANGGGAAIQLQGGILCMPSLDMLPLLGG